MEPNVEAACGRDVVYLLRSAARPLRTYVGYSTDAARRLRQHNGGLSGGARYTRVGRPWSHALIVAGFRARAEALRFEFMWKALGRLPRHRRRRGVAGRIDALAELLHRSRWTRASPAAEDIPLTLTPYDAQTAALLLAAPAPPVYVTLAPLAQAVSPEKEEIGSHATAEA